MESINNFWLSLKTNEVSRTSYRRAFLIILAVYLLVGVAVNLMDTEIKQVEVPYMRAAKALHSGQSINVVARESYAKIFVLSMIFKTVESSREWKQLLVLRLSGLLFGAGLLALVYFAGKRIFSKDLFTPILALLFLGLSLAFTKQMSLISGESFLAFIFAFFLYELIEVVHTRSLVDLSIALLLMFLLSRLQPILAAVPIVLLVPALAYGIFKEFESSIKQRFPAIETSAFRRSLVVGATLLFSYILYRFVSSVGPIGLSDLGSLAGRVFVDVIRFFQVDVTEIGILIDLPFYLSILAGLLSVVGFLFLIKNGIEKSRPDHKSNTRIMPLNGEALFSLFILAGGVLLIVFSVFSFTFVLQQNYVALLVFPLSLLFATGLRIMSYQSGNLFDLTVVSLLATNLAVAIASFIR